MANGLDTGDFVTVDAFGDVALESPERTAKESAAPSGRAGVLLIALLALGGVLVAMTALRNDDETAAPEPTPGATAAAATPAASPGAGLRTDNAPARAEVGDWYLEAEATPHTLVWPVEGGLAVLDGEGYRVIDPPIAVGVQEAAGLELFSGDGRTWGIDPTDPSSVYIVSMNQKIVGTDLEQAIAYELDDGVSLSVGVSSFGGWSAGTDLPIGTETLSVPGLGLLVLPDTGGTLLVRGTGLAPFSDDRVVAGTGQSLVAQRCDATLNCELYVTSVDAVQSDTADPGTAVELAVGTSVAPAPNGQWILARHLDDTQELVTVADNSRWPLPPGEPLAVSWAKDSSFAAWLTPQALHLAFPAEQRYETIALPDPLVASGLLVTSSLN